MFLQVLDYFFLLAELKKIVQDFCAVSFPWGEQARYFFAGRGDAAEDRPFSSSQCLVPVALRRNAEGFKARGGGQDAKERTSPTAIRKPLLAIKQSVEVWQLGKSALSSAFAAVIIYLRALLSGSSPSCRFP